MTVLRRIAPALALLVIAPLIAEFLLGDFNIRQIGFAVVFIPIYGAGALLVRELTRRSHRGWPTLLLLALAYALVMEGFANQTLFNPDYAGQRLLDYGWISPLGTSLNWTVYVLTLHVVWSVGSAVALAEALAGARWREPWLRLPGLIVTAILTLIGCGMAASYSLRTFHFVASPGQFAAVGVIVVALILAAFRFFRRHDAADLPSRRARHPGENRGEPPSPWLVLVVVLVLASLFHWWFSYAPTNHVPAGLGLAGLLGLELLAVVLFVMWSRRSGWRPVHVLAAGTGAVLTYGWLGIARLVVIGGTALGVAATPIDVVGQVLLLVVMLGVCWVGWRRLREQ
jgi:hypothetical protein